MIIAIKILNDWFSPYGYRYFNQVWFSYILPIKKFPYHKENPKLTDEKCKKCHKRLTQWELVHGCFYCAQVEKIKNKNE